MQSSSLEAKVGSLHKNLIYHFLGNFNKMVPMEQVNMVISASVLSRLIKFNTGKLIFVC